MIVSHPDKRSDESRKGRDQTRVLGLDILRILRRGMSGVI